MKPNVAYIITKDSCPNINDSHTPYHTTVWHRIISILSSIIILLNVIKLIFLCTVIITNNVRQYHATYYLNMCNDVCKETPSVTPVILLYKYDLIPLNKSLVPQYLSWVISATLLLIQYYTSDSCPVTDKCLPVTDKWLLETGKLLPVIDKWLSETDNSRSSMTSS